MLPLCTHTHPPHPPSPRGANLPSPLSHVAQLDEFFRCLVVMVNRFALASHYFWGYWAILQARYSPIDFDFIDYARLRFEGYRMHKDKFID